ncbi:replication initiator protein [Chicken microvirus mg8_95]|nr:replication initiator protein [Chicken microvirus mg8_95]
MGFNVTDGLPFPCGQCLACRINKRRVWTLRLMLENYFHEKASFVTLTYSDENLPYTFEGTPCLCKRDVQLWLKRLRKHFSDRQIRYYLAGEYGTRTRRPHYHVLVFGLSPAELDCLYLQYSGKSGEGRHSLLSDSWGFGLVHVGDVQRESIQYVAGYVTKKFTKRGDGNVPEFALMSRRPGIGAAAVAEIASVLQHYNLEKETRRELRVDGKTWPLGRFLQGKLAESLGVDFGTGEYVKRLAEQWVQANRRGADFLEYLVQSDAGRYAKLEARDKIFNQRNTL